MLTRRLVPKLVLLSGLCVVARAEAPRYFDPPPLDAIKMLPAPPSEKSAENRAELDLMLSVQDKRTQADIDRCESEVKLSIDAFRSVLGPWCTAKNLPKTTKFLAQLDKDAKGFSDAVKTHYQRQRPAAEDNRIHVPITADPTSAFPSGHATRGIIYATLLSEAFPKQRDALFERGREIGWDRVVAGLHHPSDIAAGRELGQALAQALLVDEKFKADFAEVKRELYDVSSRESAPR